MLKSVRFSQIIQSKGPWRYKFLKIFDFLIGGSAACVISKRPFKGFDGLRSDLKKILVIRPGGIGDAVFVLPFLSQIKGLHPGIEIDILCEKRNQEVFSTQSCCHQVYCYDENFLSACKVLNRPYDCIFDTEQWHYLSAVLVYCSKARIRVGFGTRKRRQKLYDLAVDYDWHVSELKNFFHLFSAIFLVGRPSTLNFDLPGPLMKWAAEEVSEKSVSLCLGGSIALRRFSFEQLREVVKGVLEKGYQVALLGGKDAAAMGKTLMSEFNDARIKDFIDKISLPQSAAVIQRTKRFIGTDSGLMHLACAVGTPVIAVFGPGDVRRWGPVGEGHRVIRRDLECSPCTQFGYTVPTCQSKCSCVNDIRTEEILSALDRSLREHSNV